MSEIVFRATVLSFVLMFGAGPSASLVCLAWCNPHAAAARGCHHDTSRTSTGIAGEHSCRDAVPGRTAVLKDDLRRWAASHSWNNLVTVPQFQLAIDWLSVRRPASPGRPPSDLKRPLATPLRI